MTHSSSRNSASSKNSASSNDPASANDWDAAGTPPAAADAFLGGRLTILQPPDHARAGIDAVLLAAAVPAASGKRALELGSGTGVASLCLAHRVAGLTVDGVELQPHLAALARQNALANGLDDRVRFEAGDVRRLPPAARGAFDHVLMNPPFHAAGATRPSPRPAKALAHAELAGDLAAWLAAGLRALRPGGLLTVIHRAERVGDLLGLLGRRAGGVVLFPLWPGAGRPAKRILLRACKGSAAPTRLLAGLTLHEVDGRFTPAAEAVLRHGAALDFSSD